MDVESSGAAKVNAPKNKLLVAILGIFGVLIVGLIIAIVVVKNLPKGEEVEVDVNLTADQVVYKKYLDFQNEILEEYSYISRENKNAILEKYKKYAAETNDEVLKVLLNTGYYQTLMLYDDDGVYKDEALNGLIEIDKGAKTVDSAINVANAARYYGDSALVEEYSAIIENRSDDLNVGGEG